MKQPAPASLSRIDVPLLGVGLVVGAFATACGIYAVFHGGERVGRDGATNAFAAIAYTGLELATCGAMRCRRVAFGLDLIFTAPASAGPAWLAGMFSMLIGVVLIVRTSSFADLLFDRERLNEEVSEDAGNADQGGLTTLIGEG